MGESVRYMDGDNGPYSVELPDADAAEAFANDHRTALVDESGNAIDSPAEEAAKNEEGYVDANADDSADDSVGGYSIEDEDPDATEHDPIAPDAEDGPESPESAGPTRQATPDETGSDAPADAPEESATRAAPRH